MQAWPNHVVDGAIAELALRAPDLLHRQGQQPGVVALLPGKLQLCWPLIALQADQVLQISPVARPLPMPTRAAEHSSARMPVRSRVRAWHLPTEAASKPTTNWPKQASDAWLALRDRLACRAVWASCLGSITPCGASHAQ